MIIGFSFNKISAQRKEIPNKSININNNVQIKDIDKEELKYKKGKEAGIKVLFEFKSSYESESGKNDIGEIVLEGELIDAEEQKIADEAVKQWKKDKKIDPSIIKPVMDAILARCNIEAIVVSREISLPPPLPMPRVADKAQGQQYIG